MKSPNITFAGLVLVRIQVLAVGYGRYIIGWVCYLGMSKYVPCYVLNCVTNEHKHFTNTETNPITEKSRRMIETRSAVKRGYSDNGG
jgi:hypothetical protein